MVRVDISQIIDHIGAIQPFSVVVSAQDVGEPDSWIEGAMTVSGQIINVGETFRLSATIEAKAEFECSRCLKVFVQTVRFQFEEDFDQVLFDKLNDFIDIAEPIRAALVFQEPMQPLCSEKCKGLCPHCGGDRNMIECECEKRTVDPRLASLSRLLENEL